LKKEHDGTFLKEFCDLEAVVIIFSFIASGRRFPAFNKEICLSNVHAYGCILSLNTTYVFYLFHFHSKIKILECTPKISLQNHLEISRKKYIGG